MQPLINFIQQLGTAGIDVLWMPLAVWSVFAVIGAGLLKLTESKISPFYQYHGRVALLLGLVAGVAGSFVFHFIPLRPAVEQSFVQPLLVIQSPVAVTASATQNSINWASPTLWVGIITAIALLLALYGIVKLLISFISLRYFSRQLFTSSLMNVRQITNKNRRLLLLHIKKPVRIVFSDSVEIPFTFGWFRQCVVLPEYLRADKEKMNMALRHELMHIQSRDYIINTVVQWVRALFFVHPLVHKFERDIEEYREICCDHKVLQGAGVSRKNYAQLLFDLSPKSVFKTSSAVNMAVQPSTLKKRIQTMKNSTRNIPSLRWSLSIMLIFGFMISGLMACSDVTDNGITATEVQQTQAQMGKSLSGVSFSKTDSGSTVRIVGKNKLMKGENQPLFIINGEKMNTPKEKSIFSRLKPGYIKSITVLKGKEAMQAYGKAGKNGVIKIKLNVPNKIAFNDLKDHAPNSAEIANSSKKTIFMVVQQMPKLKGSIASFQSHVQYPKSCSEAGIEGRVIIQFVVNKHGMPTNVHVVRGIGGGCDQAAVDAVKKYARFRPGRQQGQPVNVRMSLPVLFRLSGQSNNNQTGTIEKPKIIKKHFEVQNVHLNSNGILTGEVYTKEGHKPLTGVNILLLNTTTGSVTNSNGKFLIKNVNTNHGKLRLSYTGYQTVVTKF